MWICGPNPRTAIPNSSLKNLDLSIRFSFTHSHTHRAPPDGRTDDLMLLGTTLSLSHTRCDQSLSPSSSPPPSSSLQYNWVATMLAPDDSPYKNGMFYLSVKFPKDYPFKPPLVRAQRTRVLRIVLRTRECTGSRWIHDDS